MSLTIARLAGPAPATPVSTIVNVHTVPAGHTHVLKSIVLRNSRSDGASINYEFGMILGGGAWDPNLSPWIRTDTILAGFPKTISFDMYVLNAGDVVYLKTLTTTGGLYYEAYGLDVR